MSRKRKKKFYERPDCNSCERREFVKCYKCEDCVWKCQKRYKGIKVISAILAIPFIYMVFYKALYTTGRPLFSVWLMVATMAILDILFVATGKFVTKFFGYLEQKELEKQEEIEEAERERKEAEKQKKKEEQVDNVGKVKKLLQKFKKISHVNEGEEHPSSKFTSKEYQIFLETLNEVCDLLKTEHFKELEIRNLFEMLLPEFLTICERFEKRYEEDLLESKEREEFVNLIKGFRDKMIEVRDYLKAGENVSLKVRIETLYSFIKPEGSEHQDV